jgi:hypothetical protein
MPEAEALNMRCFEMSKELDELEFVSPEAAPLVRRLLRVAGRVIIDAAGPDASAEHWASAEEMALLWLDEALRPLGYAVKPVEGGGRPELPDVSADWH